MVGLGLLPAGCGRPDGSHPSAAPAPETIAVGTGLYFEHCAMCHYDGSGDEINLPFEKSPAIRSGDPAQLAAAILWGVVEPLPVGDRTFSGTMPAMDYLDDREIAAIATYLFATFGPQPQAVTPEQVRAVRGARK